MLGRRAPVVANVSQIQLEHMLHVRVGNAKIIMFRVYLSVVNLWIHSIFLILFYPIPVIWVILHGIKALHAQWKVLR